MEDRSARGRYGDDRLHSNQIEGQPVTAALEVSNLEGGYGRVTVLHGVNLVVPKGSLVTLLGPNGAGKTTLMKMIVGLLPAWTGCVLLEGRDVSRVAAHVRARKGMALVPEGRGMLPAMSVEENLILGTYSCPRSERKQAIAEGMERIFTMFPILGQRRRQASGSLSGGEMQMLAIARALMAKPKLLLLDEPTLGLAPVVAKPVIESLGLLKESGLTLVVVEQKSPGLLQLSDQVLLLRQGRMEGAIGKDAGASFLIDAYFGAGNKNSRQ